MRPLERPTRSGVGIEEVVNEVNIGLEDSIRQPGAGLGSGSVSSGRVVPSPTVLGPREEGQPAWNPDGVRTGRTPGSISNVIDRTGAG